MYENCPEVQIPIFVDELPANGSNDKRMKYLIGFILVLALGAAKAQNILHDQVTHFSLEDERGEIDFIVANTELRDPKPIFLWCQGSLPIPLYVTIKEFGPYLIGGGLNNFDYKKLTVDYYVVVISMPHTPVEVPDHQLSNSFCYVPDPDAVPKFSQDYLEDDYLEVYVDRAAKVWGFLKEQKWVEGEQLIVGGHSQGAKVATKFAIDHPEVSALGLFSPNPFGRVDEMIRTEKVKALTGNKSNEEADEEIRKWYRFMESAHDPDSVRAHPNLKSWASFSEPIYDDLLALEIPIFMIWGDQDRSSDLCDLMPVFFLQEGKDNLTWHRKVGLEHNFFSRHEDGRTNYEDPHWPEIMETFAVWAKGKFR